MVLFRMAFSLIHRRCQWDLVSVGTGKKQVFCQSSSYFLPFAEMRNISIWYPSQKLLYSGRCWLLHQDVAEHRSPAGDTFWARSFLRQPSPDVKGEERGMGCLTKECLYESNPLSSSCAIDFKTKRNNQWMKVYQVGGTCIQSMHGWWFLYNLWRLLGAETWADWVCTSWWEQAGDSNRWCKGICTAEHDAVQTQQAACYCC